MYVSKIMSLFFLFILGYSSSLAGSLAEKKFDVEHGMVTFEIKGGGKLSDDINITLKGEGKLFFRNNGVDALVEESYDELATGAINNIEKIQICEKFENKQRYSVDFDTKKILERAMPKGNFKDYYLAGLKKTGQERVLGYTCDVWEGDGIKKCLYKGIPLLLEHYILGVYYEKKAIKVDFDTKPKYANCTLPNFPVEKFALFKTSIKTKNIILPKEMSQVILAVAQKMHKDLKYSKKSKDDLSEKEKQVYKNMLGQHIFHKQKIFLPKLLHEMKKSRLCLQNANDLKKAKTCLNKLIDMNKNIGYYYNYEIDSFEKENKEQLLDELDEQIYFFESKMKCIRSAKNLSNLSECMK
ncbi:hypothetical protein MNB_SV-5-146 [hydrothermal vent metagenome]|uniref:Uncharacterized protein n=1 Tax=hydrothermal vent metagenome TaxID=652676 RepID=A0A1W1ECN9_9ZZZZ